MMLSRKTSFKSLTKTPKGGMRLVTRAQRPRVIRKIDTYLSSTGPKEAVFQATRDLGKKRRLNQLIFRARKRWRAIGGFVKDEEQRGTSNSKRRQEGASSILILTTATSKNTWMEAIFLNRTKTILRNPWLVVLAIVVARTFNSRCIRVFFRRKSIREKAKLFPNG